MTGPMIESLEDRAFCSATPLDAVSANNLGSPSTDAQASYAPAKPSGVIPTTQTNLVVIAIIAVLVG